MNKFTDFMRKHLWLVLVIALILICLPFMIDLYSDDWLPYYGSALAFLGTIFLGIVAFGQNERIVATQTKAQCFSRLNLKSVELYKEYDNKSNDDNIQLFSVNALNNKRIQRNRLCCLVFKNIEKSIPFEIKINWLQIVVCDENSSKIFRAEFKPIANEKTGILHSFKEDNLSAVNVYLNYEDNELSFINENTKFSLFLNMDYQNGFNVRTQGEYDAECEKVEERLEPIMFKCNIFSCSEERYNLIS